MAKVLRILFGVGLLMVVLAGCGGGAPQDSAAHGVPPALAHEWETRATAIANAAAAGNSCEAQHLAASLRNDVVNSRSKVPRRLRSALLTGVYSLADHTECTRVVTVQTPPPTHPSPGPKPKPKPPKPHEPPGHGKGHDNHSDGNGQ
jgi:hypothetical protein